MPQRARTHGNRHSVRTGIDLRPGAVREARLAAGLSFAQVAGGELSRAAVQLVESGKSRPSLATLRLIAEATGHPISFFLPEGAHLPEASSGSRLAELEAMAAAGRFAELAELGPRAIAETRDHVTRARMHVLAARASGLLSDASAALEHALAAKRELRHGEDSLTAADAMAWEAAALFGLGDPGATDALRGALTTCRALDPVPAEMEARILTNLASAMVAAHRWDEAVESYDAAVRAAAGLLDLGRLARTYDGLALAHRGRGDLERSEAYLNRAIAIHEMANAQDLEAGTRTNYSELLLSRGRADEAWQQAAAALALLDRAGSDRFRGRTLTALAAAAASRGDAARARPALEEALRVTSGADAIGHAEALRVRARLAALGGSEFRRDFEAAMREFEAEQAMERARECRIEYAQALENDGDDAAALRQWKMAALNAEAEERSPLAGANRATRRASGSRRQ